jgi:hypothetical protein
VRQVPPQAPEQAAVDKAFIDHPWLSPEAEHEDDVHDNSITRQAIIERVCLNQD